MSSDPIDPDDPMLLVPGPDAPHGFTLRPDIRRADDFIARCDYLGCDRSPLDPIHLDAAEVMLP